MVTEKEQLSITVCRNICDFIKIKKITYEEILEKSGVLKKDIDDILKLKPKNYSLTNLQKICDVLDISLIDIFK